MAYAPLRRNLSAPATKRIQVGNRTMLVGIEIELMGIKIKLMGTIVVSMGTNIILVGINIILVGTIVVSKGIAMIVVPAFSGLSRAQTAAIAAPAPETCFFIADVQRSPIRRPSRSPQRPKTRSAIEVPELNSAATSMLSLGAVRWYPVQSRL